MAATIFTKFIELFMTDAQKKRRLYGLTKFERKLFVDWLDALGINHGKLSVEQRLKYIQYPGFQYLLDGYRITKPRRKIWRSKYFWIVVSLVVACILYAVVFFAK